MEAIPQSFEAARKRRIELHDAMEGLETALARPSAAADWRVGVSENLVNLAEAYQSHIHEVEAPAGILVDLLEDAPRLSNYVDILRSDHVTLLAELEALIREAPELEARELRETATGVLGDLVRHRQLGADLVWDAVMIDIGGPS